MATAFAAKIINRGAKPITPNKCNIGMLHRFSKRAYKGRNVIERCFCRIKDFRRVRNALRQTWQKLLGCRAPRRNRCILDPLSLDPNSTLTESIFASVFQGFVFGSMDTVEAAAEG